MGGGPKGGRKRKHDYKLGSSYAEDMVYHKEQLVEPKGQATVGSNTVWTDPAPPEAAQPVPQERHVFDGTQASAAAVGLGDRPTEEPVLLVDEEQDEDRRKFERGKEKKNV